MKNKKTDHTIFDSAGLWERSNVNASELRKLAWDRKIKNDYGNQQIH
jgi:hypothetical protein